MDIVGRVATEWKDDASPSHPATVTNKGHKRGNKERDLRTLGQMKAIKRREFQTVVTRHPGPG